MAGAAEAQAKQLDSVTDVVHEQEVDANKAQQAMSALSVQAADAATAPAPAVIFKEDVIRLIGQRPFEDEDLFAQSKDALKDTPSNGKALEVEEEADTSSEDSEVEVG